jgi:putative serine protease PepD
VVSARKPFPPPGNTMSDVQQDGIRASRARPYGRDVDARPSHRAVPVTAQRQKLARAGTMILLVLALAMLCGLIGAAMALLVHPLRDGTDLAVRSSPARSGVNLPISSVEEVAAKVLPSVVTLQSEVGGQSYLGSGIVLTPGGLIMTNNHVVAAMAKVPRESVSAMVTFNDGRTAAFSVVATDPKNDIAIVRAQGISRLTPISFGSSAHLRVGQSVVAVGSPLGLDDTVTTGVISALDRPVSTTADGDSFAVFDAIQTDTALNPGNSGGALVDMNGELVGVNSASAAPGVVDDNSILQIGSVGLGFAIPADSAKRISDELIATGTASHGSLGVQVDTDPSAHGATIIGVGDGSPAAASGLSNGALITKIDHQIIENADAFVAAVQSRAPGTRVTVGIIDPSGRQRIVDIILGSDQNQR